MTKRSEETKWLHNPQELDKTLFYRQWDGISVEHMIRPSNFDMRCNHFHPEYELYLLVDGRRRFFFDNRSYLAEKGSLALIDSSQIHMTHSVPDDPDDHYERIILYVHKAKVEEYDRCFPELGMGEFLRQHYGIYVLSIEEAQRAMDMFKAVMRELDAQQSKGQAMIDMEIMRFFIGFWRANRPVTYLKDKQSDKKKGKYTTAYSVSDYISEHFCEQISLEKLAEEFYVSQSYLSRSFKEVSGFGISEYVNLLRIRKAQAMLEDPDLTISEISEAVGFESTSYFGRVFQKHLAISPSQYRRELSRRDHKDPDKSP